jgi:hypothetical protein
MAEEKRKVVPTGAPAEGTAALPMPDVKALVFDTFGTLVDWRSGVAREAERILKPMGYELDWLMFADAWRAEYRPSMEEVRSGRRPFVKLDILHRENLVAFFRVSISKNSMSRPSRSLIWPGTNSTLGPMSVQLSRGCTSGS